MGFDWGSCRGIFGQPETLENTFILTGQLTYSWEEHL